MRHVEESYSVRIGLCPITEVLDFSAVAFLPYSRSHNSAQSLVLCSSLLLCHLFMSDRSMPVYDSPVVHPLPLCFSALLHPPLSFSSSACFLLLSFALTPSSITMENILTFLCITNTTSSIQPTSNMLQHLTQYSPANY